MGINYYFIRAVYDWSEEIKENPTFPVRIQQDIIIVCKILGKMLKESYFRLLGWLSTTLLLMFLR